MPGMVVFRRRWSVGSDDLVLPAFFLFLLHCAWLVILSMVVFSLEWGRSCSVTLVDHGRGYLGILVSCLICESAIMWLSMRGSILYTQPRDAVQYVLYIRLAILLVELVYAVVGIVWLWQYYQPCSDVMAKNLTLGIVACNWLVIFSFFITLLCTFDPTGRTFVKLKATRRRKRTLTTYTLRHRLEEGQASSWTRRLKLIMCCTRAQDSQSDAYAEVAMLFAEFFRDLDIVPSDIIAGLVLLRQRQRAKRSTILDQANNDILAFLSGIPVTRNTKYLDLKNSAVMSMYKDVCYYMLFALAAYGWPMYLLRKPGCGLCHLASSCPCVSVSGSQLSQMVTVEEDNCCGCNLLAIRRHFLDQDLKQVHIIYTSCHDDVYETPFFVAVDHDKKKVIISIRGTLSPKDALTDLTGDAERLPVEEPQGTWLGHKGMVFSAEYIKKKLEQNMILSQAFGRDLGKGTMRYGLVIVGHSLGAGTAAILSFLLRPQYPTLHCYSYSPPGGLLSEDAMEISKEFVTAVVLGKDLVPRLGLSQLEGFRRHLLEVLQKSNKPKWRIIMGGTKCIPKSELPMDDAPQGLGDTPSNTRLWLHPSDLSMALSSSTPLYPPGKIIHVVHNHPAESCCGQEEPTYSALWADNKAFDEVIISPAMLNEHLPHMVMEGLNKVLENYNKGKTALLSAAKIMVSPTEMDLAPDSYLLAPPNPNLRRNSSVRSCVPSELSLDGFSECAPTTGVSKHFTVQHWGGLKAPLAATESLSDAESLYSVDIPRCSPNPAFPRKAPLLKNSSAAATSYSPRYPHHLSPAMAKYPFYISPPAQCFPLHLSPPTPPKYPHHLSPPAPPKYPHHLSPPTPPKYPHHLSPPTPPKYPHHLFPPTPSYPFHLSTHTLPKYPHTLSAAKLSLVPQPRAVIDSGVHQVAPNPYTDVLSMGSRDFSRTLALPSLHCSPTGPPPARAGPQEQEGGKPQPGPDPAATLPHQTVLEFSQLLDGLLQLESRETPALGFSDEESESGRGSYDLEEGLDEGARTGQDHGPKPDQSSSLSLSSSFPLSSSGELNDLSPSDGSLPLQTAALYSGENVLSSLV
ncbi:diacylglycerol lipase-alpha-like isoform X2 [Conger conger]|uniref:diacylglycerol lipase-alpha-like isoform X2 n=1 Tax=Conger conger TaxID=82655 RepID=UPI002A5A6328|nr:diacylglycerol lipase-alpha-like isoform X2 [Conger conger]